MIGWWWFGIVVASVAVAVGLFVAALPWIVQPLLRFVLFFRYDLRAIGLENLPKTGPALIVSNHLSWFDGFFLAATIPRLGSALVNGAIFQLPVVGFLARRCGLIPVPYSGPKAQRAAIEAGRSVLDRGKVLAIFPEGQLSRTGMTGPFFRGLEAIVGKRDDVPVIPLYLDNVWGSVMSFSGGRFFRKWPIGWRRTIVAAYGPPLPRPISTFEVRQAVIVQGVKARAALPKVPTLPEPIDFALPHLDHPTLGRLTGSAKDVQSADSGVSQVGTKPGTVGHPLPGVAIRAVDEQGRPLSADEEGRLQALVPHRADWVDLGQFGKIDRDGFVTLSGPSGP